MKIGILGSGDVGQALGRGLAKHGHDVMIGSRQPESEALQAWKKVASENGRAATGTFEEAAKHGDIVVLATNGMGTEPALDLAKPGSFAGKVVIDATNPLDFSGGMPPSLFVGTTDSLGERVQRKLPEARVVKCWNIVSNAKMIDPQFAEGTPPMLICGDDAEAKKRVETLLREVGWPGIIDVGGIDGARWLEAVVPLWVRVGASLDTWGHMFKPVQ